MPFERKRRTRDQMMTSRISGRKKNLDAFMSILLLLMEKTIETWPNCRIDILLLCAIRKQLDTGENYLDVYQLKKVSIILFYLTKALFEKMLTIKESSTFLDITALKQTIMFCLSEWMTIVLYHAPSPNAFHIVDNHLFHLRSNQTWPNSAFSIDLEAGFVFLSTTFLEPILVAMSG